MDTEALIELYLMSAGWKPSERDEGLWDHGSANLYGVEPATAYLWARRWEASGRDDDGPEPEEDPHKDDWMQYLDEPDSEPDCED